MLLILGEEGVPVQVDGEAWSQPPGILRIVHKNRVQMLCRNRVSIMLFESYIKLWLFFFILFYLFILQTARLIYPQIY